MSYQGHKNRNHWNVALWLFNDYDLYALMRSAVSVARTRDDAAKFILRHLVLRQRDDSPKTPDAVPYSFASIRAALVGWES